MRWRRDLERAGSTGFWEGKCGTKREVRENKGNAGGKGSTGMWNETQSKLKHKMQTGKNTHDENHREGDGN